MVRPKAKKRVKYVKTPIVWKADVSRDELDIKPIAYPPHFRRSTIGLPSWATSEPQMGQLFTTTTNLFVRDTQYEKEYYVRKYLRKTFVDFKIPMLGINVLQRNYDAPPIPKGSMAMYTGTFHVSETAWHSEGAEIRTLCHSFIIGGARYIINDLNFVKPA